MKKFTQLFTAKRGLLLTLLIITIASAVRLAWFNQVPPSLYWEEVALGYDAYSIAETGKDHHGNTFPLVAFESFGDWKPSLYFYTIVPFIWIFGLSEAAVRLPSFISGIVIIVSVVSICKTILADLKANTTFIKYFPWITGLATAISPWAIHFSRSAWEVHLATALISSSVAVGLTVSQSDTLQRKLIRSSLTALLLSLAAYAYHGTRLIAPLVGVLLGTYWLSSFRFTSVSAAFQKLKWLAAPAVLGLLLLTPIVLSLTSNVGTQRFAETSIFSELDIIIESNTAIEAAGGGITARLLFHRYFFYFREIAANFLDHFRLDFLFLSGDINPRHNSGYLGLLYYQDALFLLVGLWTLLRRKPKQGLLILGWWLISVLPASLTKTTPHALRSLPAMPAILIFIGFGLSAVLEYLPNFLSNAVAKKYTRTTLLMVISAAYLLTFSVWSRHYFTIYPKQQAHEWQYGSQQMVATIEKLRTSKNDLPVFITREQGRPAMYYWFYTKQNPINVQAAENNARKDQSEFLEFETISFINSANEISASQAIVASSAKGISNLEARGYSISDTQTIYFPNGEVSWHVYTISK